MVNLKYTYSLTVDNSLLLLFKLCELTLVYFVFICDSPVLLIFNVEVLHLLLRLQCLLAEMTAVKSSHQMDVFGRCSRALSLRG